MKREIQDIPQKNDPSGVDHLLDGSGPSKLNRLAIELHHDMEEASECRTPNYTDQQSYRYNGKNKFDWVPLNPSMSDHKYSISRCECETGEKGEQT